MSLGSYLEFLMQQKDAQAEREKQIEAAGKSADFAVKANPKMLEDLGITPDAWKNLGAIDKAAAFKGWGSAMAIKENERQQAEADRQTKAGEDFRQLLQPMMTPNDAAAGIGRGPLMQMLSPELAGQLQQMGSGRLDPDAVLQAGLRSGVDISRISTLADALARVRTAARTGRAAPAFMKAPSGEDVAYSLDTGTFQFTPSSKSAAEAESKDGTIEIPDETDPIYGPRIRIPLSIAEKKYPHLLRGLQQKGATTGKPLDEKTAAAILKEANGDKAKARKLATERGYALQ